MSQQPLLLLQLLLLLTLTSVIICRVDNIGDSSTFSFVQITDIHIGDANSTLRLQNAVKEINRMVQTNQRDIRFVFATGDLTSSAVHRQFEICRNVLNQLVVPWIPMIGNHDIWTYNSTYEEPFPTGDLFFGQLFADQFRKIQQQFGTSFEYTRDTVINQEHKNITSWFHNFVLQVNDKLTIVALDWNSRKHAAKQLGYKGSWPGAELHNFAGGTFQWLETQLQQIKQSGVLDRDFKIMFLQHHPFRTPTFVPELIYSFSASKKKEIRTLLDKYLPIDKYWGHFAGHFHRWYYGKAFDEKEWKSFLQWESCACKADGSFAVINIENYNQVQSIEKVVAGPTK